MFFNPFAPDISPRLQGKRHSRLKELDMRMHDFLASKQGRASATVIEKVASARDHVRREIEHNSPAGRTK